MINDGWIVKILFAHGSFFFYKQFSYKVVGLLKLKWCRCVRIKSQWKIVNSRKPWQADILVQNRQASISLFNRNNLELLLRRGDQFWAQGWKIEFSPQVRSSFHSLRFVDHFSFQIDFVPFGFLWSLDLFPFFSIFPGFGWLSKIISKIPYFSRTYGITRGRDFPCQYKLLNSN